MAYLLNKDLINGNNIKLIHGADEYKGVVRVMEMVATDLSLVFGARPEVAAATSEVAVTTSGVPTIVSQVSVPTISSILHESSMPIICGTLGRSLLITALTNSGLIDLADIENKREVYKLQVVNIPRALLAQTSDADDAQVNPFTTDNAQEESLTALIIAGSDKRGTIYGLFKLSELLGVSPFVDWLNDKPVPLDHYEFPQDFNYISKEPSVRYRGFFINDEWPAFGTWCNKRFGGFTKECYIHIFELLLRLKGNYLWPAMWSSIFSGDGPGMDNAILADELGIVMGTSHHEPCLRHGEEYKYLRGRDSIYGDAWNFRTNEEGITRFWEDGLKRSGHLENVITVGMRGEADSTIMGEDATLKDNIELLEDVLKTQNRLIRENVCEDLTKVPRMLALYKEVEPFFYGDENTRGLMDNPELEGVTLLLCDDNFGNMRTLPTEQMRAHKGGYGMYYHFDYHGWPISYEWVNSSYLPKIWEQMTEAYEFGVRDIWIVNVGDVFTMEYPLSYFLDLAYDYDRWGISNLNSAREYTEAFVTTVFKGKISATEINNACNLLMDYTKIASTRRPEAMNDRVYSPSNYSECEELLEKCEDIMGRAQNLYDAYTGAVRDTYYQLIYYPLMANLNLQKLWLATSMNHYLTSIKASEALVYADMIEECLGRDEEIVDELHSFDNGRWYGMGLSEHIGFTRWNEEECQYPVIYRWKNANKPRIVVTIKGKDEHTEGQFWSGRDLTIKEFLDPDISEAVIRLYSACGTTTDFACHTDSEYLGLSATNGSVPAYSHVDITINLDRSRLDANAEGLITIDVPGGCVHIHVPVNTLAYDYPANTYIMTKDYISIEAEHYTNNVPYQGDKFVKLPEYGKTLSGMKVIPVTNTYADLYNAPYLEYSFVTENAGEYEITLFTTPSNPTYRDNQLNVGIICNNTPQIISMIPDDYRVSDDNDDWKTGVLNNIRGKSAAIDCISGLNTIRICALSTGLVLQKLIINPKGIKVPYGYLGPKETYRIK